MNNVFKWKGQLNIKKYNNGQLIKDYNINNRIMNNGLDELLKALYTNSTNLVLKHIAIGDSDTAGNDTDTTLYNEFYRVPVLTLLKSGTGVLQSYAVLLDTEPTALSGICTIKEIGFFAGSTSYNWDNGNGKNTGIMIARLVLASPESKTATEQIDFTRTDTFSRG
jgi:hypothetical protein